MKQITINTRTAGKFTIRYDTEGDDLYFTVIELVPSQLIEEIISAIIEASEVDWKQTTFIFLRFTIGDLEFILVELDTLSDKPAILQLISMRLIDLPERISKMIEEQPPTLQTLTYPDGVVWYAIYDLDLFIIIKDRRQLDHITSILQAIDSLEHLPVDLLFYQLIYSTPEITELIPITYTRDNPILGDPIDSSRLPQGIRTLLMFLHL